MTAAHILTYAQTLAGGGVERAQLRLAGEWIAAGRRVTLVAGSAQGPLADELPAGIDLVELGSTRYRALLALAPIVRRLAPDLIFCPGNHYGGIAAATRARLERKCPPVLAKLSNALVRPDQPRAVALGYRAWLRLHPRFVDHLVAMTPAMRDEAIAAMRMPPARVSVIANPPARARPGAAAVGLPAGRFVLGVGRLAPQKRWDRLLDAFARLEFEGALVILGEGPLRGELAAQARRLGIAGRVHMPGHAGDPAAALAQATVVALTSDYEGVPGVLREALAQGTPVVASDASVALREIVASPAVGTVVARDDTPGLVAALAHWTRPGQPRPTPVVPPGEHAGAEYLALIDRLVSARR